MSRRLAPPTPFTPERIKAVTTNDDDSFGEEMFERAKRMQAVIKQLGINPLTQPLDWAIALPATPDMEAEYDEADESGLSAMEALTQALLLPAALTDPDGGAPAIFYGDRVIEPAFESRLNLGAPAHWIERNLHELAGEPRNVAVAARHLLQMIAEERELPELDQIANDPAAYSHAPAVRMRPYVVVLVALGAPRPEELQQLQQLLEATRSAPIYWMVPVVVPEDERGAVLDDYSLAAFNSPNFSALAFTRMRDIAAESIADNQSAIGDLIAGLGGWYRLMKQQELVEG